MSALDDELRLLRERIDMLARVKTQEDFDEGARLHNEKNAPWVSGMYSHLRFDPYVYQEYPKALYTADYLQAKREAHNAKYLSGVTDQERQEAIKEAERVLAAQTCAVGDEAAERLRLGQGWAITPEAALAVRKAAEHELSVQAAHLAYEDRNLGEKARAEREAADNESEGHLVEVPAKRGRPRKDVTANV